MKRYEFTSAKDRLDREHWGSAPKKPSSKVKTLSQSARLPRKKRLGIGASVMMIFPRAIKAAPLNLKTDRKHMSLPTDDRL